MCFKVVIVEDNPATVRSLVQTIDWHALQCELVGTAVDGESGRSLILDTQPDIVLTDIRMPRLNGLEMIEDVRKDMPECKFIIITGYDQFQYASRAIKLAVFDYLLKPIDNAEVERSVRRATMMTQRQLATDVALEQAGLLKKRAQLLSLLTNDSQRGQGVHDMLVEAGLESDAYYVMVVQQTQEKVYSQATLNHLEAVCARRGVQAVTILLYDSAVIYVQQNHINEQWQEEAGNLAADFAAELVDQVHIGISKMSTSRHGIRQAYFQARQALWEIALRKHPRGCNFYQEPEDGHPVSERVAEMHRRIDELIDLADLSDEAATEAATVLVEQSGHQYSNLRAMIALYAMALRKKFAVLPDEKMDAALYDTWFVSSEEDAKRCLLKLSAAIREARDTPRYSLLTRNALQYIHLHAIEGLQLNDVAKNLFVSANYLSALIRKETGVTFHEHVLEAKMSVARTMLADPRILVEEVAHAVGYSNYISFYNAFKRIEQMTPTEYRNQRVEV